uniref:Uncharacterized protein n=1 Tax=Hanusia phi TaxID=3032 RepID=A0A7S0HQK7_9CRYP|mmetsp:Transcript_3274/g.7913  ORF Transcript_3274/g.7913 Transcript_3274/m.7913 type:complete len:152 (+) Transcript_3274:113-568(+)
MQDCADDASFNPQPQGDGSILESLPATLATDSQVSVASVVQSSVPVVSSNLNAGSGPASACKESKPRIKWPKDERRVQELMLLVARCFLDMPEKILDGEIEKQWIRLIEIVSKEDSFFVGTYWKTIRAKFEHYLHLFRAERNIAASCRRPS